MLSTRLFRWMGAALVAGAIAVAGSSPGPAPAAAAQAAGSATPAEGVPQTSFTFRAAGFLGAVGADDDEDAPGERVAYWINTPGGGVIAVEELDEETDSGNRTRPLQGRADGDGAVALSWAAPANAAPGSYSAVIRGLTSGYEAVIPFRIAPDGSQAVVQTHVTPAAGAAGTLFTFRATGFTGGAADDDTTGERASYWINTPGGGVIAVEELDEETDTGSTTAPLVAQADGDGQVKIFWTAPEDAAAGAYSLVVYGLESRHQVVIPFSIR